eukprot:6207613-Pleurochrysis_carterae.AAC.1
MGAYVERFSDFSLNRSFFVQPRAFNDTLSISFFAACSSNHSGGVSLSRKFLYFRQSSSCSSNLDMSDLICVICAFNFLISCTFSAFALVSASAFLMA